MHAMMCENRISMCLIQTLLTVLSKGDAIVLNLLDNFDSICMYKDALMYVHVATYEPCKYVCS